MTEQYTIVGKCLGEITVKIWKQGGSVKCPDQTTNTYPKPSQFRINQIISDACLSCSRDSDIKRINKLQGA